ncbi:MAG TPA: MarR family transcriptional regulator [Streptosporangiaceae bacterium]
MHERDRVANLLGASALALTDLALSGATHAAGVTTSGAAALVSLASSSGLSVTELGRRVGLSQPAASRLVDSLEADGLAERRRNPYGGRWMIIHATDAGRETALRLLAARGDPLTEVVSVLDADECDQLSGLLEKLLTRVYERVGEAQYICRMCDKASCVAEPHECPVGAAERAHGAEPSE